MPAHLRDLVRPCQHAGCAKAATVALYNTRNAHMGDYCATHGRHALNNQLAIERQER